MVATPRQRDELQMWEKELSVYEHKVSVSYQDPFELAHWQHMCEYAAHRIILIEKEMYQGA